MAEHHCKKIVFSSSAAIYGSTKTLPITENTPAKPNNPYGQTKWDCEKLIQQQSINDPSWKTAILRYFNPIGAHPSGLLGENPKCPPSNLLPILTKVALKQQDCLPIYGAKYPTKDGSALRDYIPIMDLAQGHLDALKNLNTLNNQAINLGRGQGVSVFEILQTLEKILNEKIPYQIKEPRPGDVHSCYADINKAKQYLNWESSTTLEQALKDQWQWQKHLTHEKLETA
jgi:UDP-glucose 4-epimerase